MASLVQFAFSHATPTRLPRILSSWHSAPLSLSPLLPSRVRASSILAQAHAVISSCLAGRVERYPMSESVALGRLIHGAPQLANEDLYMLSLRIEPRGRYS